MQRISEMPGVIAAAIAVLTTPAVIQAAGTTVSDSLYNAHHPRLLFTASELPALRAKVSDGGYDDTAYDFLRYLAEHYYPLLEPADMMAGDTALNAIPNLGLAAHLETPPDTASIRMGRELVVYIAEHYGVDNDEAGSGSRLRSLALGYDMFFADAPETLRAMVRDEIISYVTFMTTGFTYELFTWRPYLANHTAMFAGPLGMAAICLRDEADPELLDDAMGAADAAIDSLLTHQFDPLGAYKEGCLYGAWTLRQLIFYFHARERYDGFAYADHPVIRAAEEWFPYEMLPEGWGKTNNLNDSPYYSTPLARNTTYFDWAQSRWNSALSAWMWEHTAGPYGIDLGAAADKASTVLWNAGLAPVQPDSVLPESRLWRDRGLYYYRTGWQSGMSARDVVFSFYSGKFHGGHAQEDQNQFTLYAYGGKFAIDHGAGSKAKQSESHNIVFVDGAGQHNAGASIGTDGSIAACLLSAFADVVTGDATAAYTTYSEFNAPDWPFPGWDWSWGYSGANPVRHARRSVVVVHDAASPPYFVLCDDIEKDGALHDYQWRLHTSAENSVDAASNPIRIDAPTSALDIYVLYPEFSSLARTTQPYDNGVPDPDATLLALAGSAVNPRFTCLLFPSDSTVPAPEVTSEIHPWGYACRLDWGGGVSDIVLGNHSGGIVTWGPDSLRTDASMAIVRATGAQLTRHLLVGATRLDFGGTDYARFYDDAATCALAGDVVRIDRGDAVFRLLDSGIERIECEDEPVAFVRRGGYLWSDSVASAAGVAAPPDLRVSVYPNPFNPTVSVRIETPAGSQVKASVYDAAGRLVCVLMDAAPPRAITTLRWEGVNQSGRAVSSGVYFLKVSSAGAVRTHKLVVVK
jgi:hypothetical protein